MRICCFLNLHLFSKRFELYSAIAYIPIKQKEKIFKIKCFNLLILLCCRSATMKVSYPKAIDVWYAFCMLLVFGALVEFAFVNVLVRRRTPKKRMMPTGPYQPSKSIRHHADPEDQEEPLNNDKTVIVS